MSENTIKTVRIMLDMTTKSINSAVSMSISEETRTLELVDEMNAANNLLIGIEHHHGRYIVTSMDTTGDSLQALENIEGFEDGFILDNKVISYFS